MRIAGTYFYRLLKNCSPRIDPSEIEQRNALIDCRDLEFGVERGSLFKGLQCLVEELLVHVGDAEIVETSCFDGLVWLDWVRRVLRGGCEDCNRREHDTGTNERKRLSHAKNKLAHRVTVDAGRGVRGYARIAGLLFRRGKAPGLAVGFGCHYAFAFLNRDGLASIYV